MGSAAATASVAVLVNDSSLPPSSVKLTLILMLLPVSASVQGYIVEPVAPAMSERPRATPAPPRSLTAADIKKLLDFIPDNPVGLRDRAIILTLILTGRRRAEVLNLKVSDLIQDGEAVYYSYRGKGGKHGKRELPRPAFQAIQQALAAFGKDLAAMKPEESLWPSSADSGRGITSGTFYGNLLRYFKAAGLMPAGMHIFRHSAAKLRREAGESVEQVSRFLDHSSLAVTTVYLRQLEGDRDTAWEQVAENLGLTSGSNCA